MSALRIDISITSELAADLRTFTAGLQQPEILHDAIAGALEIFMKQTAGPSIASEDKNHTTAMSLGAPTTRHLHDAYQGITSRGEADGAFLLVPRYSRLRAAFGKYVLTPKNGSKYLTIPAAREAYGKRAGEFDDLFFTRVGPRGTPVLARRRERVDPTPQGRSAKGKRYDRTKPLEVMYVLVAKATIPEDKTLIPFDDLEAAALDTTQQYLSELRRASPP